MHAGNNVNIKEAGESYSGVYFLTSVTHRLVPMKGYTVNFEGFRNALPSPPKVPPKDAQPQEEKKKEEGKLNPEFTNLSWKLEDKAVEKAHAGDKLKLTADCSQMGSMKSVNVKIYEKDTTTPDDFIEEIKGKVIGGNKVEAAWTAKEETYNEEIIKYKFIIETLGGKHSTFGKVNSSIMEILNPIFEITLEIDPNNPESNDDKYTLFSQDGKYRQTLSSVDDRKKDDKFTTLHFSGIIDGLKYNLQVNPGKEGKPYFMFQDMEINTETN